VFCDAHLHLVDLESRDREFANRPLPFEWRGAVVSHDAQEFELSEGICRLLPSTVAGFGIHPQNPDMSNAETLIRLCRESRIGFIGEAGFDFFGDTPLRMRTAQAMRLQTEAFLFQVKLAASEQLPLVIHIRKATDVLMAHSRELELVPSVIFHCWPGRLEEARMLIGKGINAFFSFGTPLLRDSRHALETLSGLPPERLLSETDAPWQPPHGCAWTELRHIRPIVEKMAAVRGLPLEEMQLQLLENFRTAFGLEQE
jgi:TatD DNase family protein